MSKPGAPGKLTPQKARFAEEFCVDMNATQAALRAGYSEKTAYSQGQRLLKTAEVQEVIQAARQLQRQRIEISADRTIFEAARLAFYDLRKLYNEDDTLKSIHTLDDDTAAALQGIETFEEYTQDGTYLGRVRKVRMAPKMPAIKTLGQHLGVFQRAGLSGDDISFLEQLSSLILRHVHEVGARSEIAGFIQGYVSGASPSATARAIGAGSHAA